MIRTAGRTILIDTSAGNDRDRPQIPSFAHLHTNFLERLAAAGVKSEDVDTVINTHIHYDHVGWNTRLIAGVFVPTFPSSTYLVPQADYDCVAAVVRFGLQSPAAGQACVGADEAAIRRWPVLKKLQNPAPSDRVRGRIGTQ